jgi:succinoglycan biosynthesis protein ExoA
MAMHLGFSVGFTSHLVTRKILGKPAARFSAHVDMG